MEEQKEADDEGRKERNTQTQAEKEVEERRMMMKKERKKEGGKEKRCQYIHFEKKVCGQAVSRVRRVRERKRRV